MAYIPPLNGGRLNASFAGNTAGASMLLSSGTMVLAGGNNITLSQTTGVSGATISINGPAGGVFLAGMSTGGNTSGTTGFATNQLVLAGGNNITLSQATGAGGNTLSISAASQTNQTLAFTAGTTGGGNTSLTSNGTFDARSFYLNALGAATAGFSSSSMFVSVPVQTNQSINIYGVGNTTGGSSSSARDARSLSISGLGAVSVGFSSNSVLMISAPNTIAQTNQSLGFTAGTTGGGNTSLTSTGTFDARSFYLNALGAATAGFSASSMFVSVATQTAQTMGIYATGANTVGNSSSSARDARSFSMSGGGAVSIGFVSSNSVLNISAPAVSSLSATGILSISNNGSTVSIGAPAFSVGMSTIGNTAGTTGTVSNQFILAGGNNITLSQSTGAGGNTLSISAANQSAQTQSNIAGIIAGAATASTGTISFANSNGVSFGLNGQTLTASAAGAAQSNQVITVNASGANTIGNTSSGTLDARSFNISGQGGVSVGLSGSTLQISAPTQSIQTQNLQNVTVGGTNTSGVLANVSSGALTLAGGNNITLSQAGNAITISGGAGGGAGSNTFGMSNLGNTSGTTGVVSGSAQQLILAGGNNITLSQSINGASATITLSAASQSIQTQGIAAVSFGGNTAGSNYTNSSGTISLYAGSNMTFSRGVNNSVTLVAGGGIALGNSEATFSNGTVGLAAAPSAAITIQSNTNGGQVFNLSVPGTSSLVALGNLTISSTGSTINFSAGGGGGGGVVLSAPGGSISSGTANFSVSSGAMTISNAGQTLNFAVPATSSLVGVNGITISRSGSTISISGGGGGGIAMYGGTNSITSGTASFANSNGVSFGVNGQTVTGSVAPVSSLSGVGAVGLSSNGSTISVSAPFNGTVGNWEPQVFGNGPLASTQLGQSSLYFFKLQPMAYVSATQLHQMISLSMSSSSNSSHAGAISVYAGIYTANGATLSLITQSSGSSGYSWSNTSNNSYNSVTGLRGLTMPLGASMTPGNYWLGMMSRTSSTNANWFTASNLVYSNITNSTQSYMGIIGQASNATQGIQEGVGFFSAATAALPASVAMSAITQSKAIANNMPYIAFKNSTW
jgi:hypothetical protein